MANSRKVKVSTTIDLETGEYEMVYNNVSHPGESMDYNEISRFLKAIFAKNEKQVREDAETGKTGQASLDKDDLN